MTGEGFTGLRAHSMKMPKLGSGGRFKLLNRKLEKQGARNPKALAAWIGMEKYGKKKMQSMALKGKKG